MIPRKFYILCLVLIVAVVVNTIVHFSSPAYRYYREVARRQDDTIALFKRQVTAEILPNFVSSISNVVKASSSTILTNALGSAGAGAASPAPADSVCLPKLPDVISSAYVFKCGGDFYLSFAGHYYRVGDFFAGHRILEIYPNTLITDQQIICIGSGFDRMFKDDK